MSKGIIFSQRLLARYIVAQRADGGFAARVADRLSLRTGETYHRQEVSTWLHSDPTIRVEPKLGAGFMLIESCREQEAAEELERKAKCKAQGA